MEVFNEAMSKQTNVTYTEPLDTSAKNFSHIYTDTKTAISVTFTNDIYETSVTSYTFAICSFIEDDENSIRRDHLFHLRDETEDALYSKELHDEIADILDEINYDSYVTFCSTHIEGDLIIGENNVRFTPFEELLPNKTYLILIDGILDSEFKAVMPYISLFKTIPDGSIPENEETEEVVSEEVLESESISINVNELIINEILADPPDGTAGDANQDGVRSSYDDEFIEIYNTTERTIPLKEIKIAVGSATTIKHEFSEADTILAHGFIAIFSGGTPLATLNGSKVAVSNTSLGLSNSGTSVFILYNDTIINHVSYGSEGGKNQSLTRSPAFSETFAVHSEAYPNLLFSPGFNP
jgi:hypothetical protein